MSVEWYKLHHHSFHRIRGRTNVVDFEDHLNQLSGQQNLTLFTVQSLNDVSLLHVVVTSAGTIDAESSVRIADLLGFDFGQSVDGIQSGILGQCQRNGFQSIGKCTERVLFNGLDLKLIFIINKYSSYN